MRGLNLSSNRLSSFSGAEQFASLARLDLSGNKLTAGIGVESLGKLKELFLQGNPFTDKKLSKLAEAASEGDGKAMKQLLTHLRDGKSKAAQKKTQQRGDGDAKEGGLISKFGGLLSAEAVQVVMEKDFCLSRPYYAAVVVKGVDLSKEERLARFLALQLKLQGTRRHLGIGSHDFASMGCQQLQLAAAEQTECFEALHAADSGAGDGSTLRGSHPISEWMAHWRSKDSSRAGYVNKAIDSDGKVCILRSRGGPARVFTLYPVSNCEISKTTGSTSECFIEVSGNGSVESVKAAMVELLGFLVDEECWQSKAEVRFQRVRVLDWKSREVLPWEQELGNVLERFVGQAQEG